MCTKRIAMRDQRESREATLHQKQQDVISELTTALLLPYHHKKRTPFRLPPYRYLRLI